MITEVQTVDGSSQQFDATANEGLVTFASINETHDSKSVHARIRSIGMYTAGALTTYTVFLKGDEVTERITLFTGTATDWSKTGADCDIIVPRQDSSQGDSYELHVTTTGIDGDTTLTVVWDTVK